MISNKSINSNNIYKLKNTLKKMKERVSISLDEDTKKEIDKLCEKSFGAKRSTVINSILKKHFKMGAIKKRT